MQTDTIQSTPKRVTSGASTATMPNSGGAYSHFQVIRRNGRATSFNSDKIKIAMTKAFLEVEGNSAAASSRIHEIVDKLTEQVSQSVTRRLSPGDAAHIEDIQDQVELVLMRNEHHKAARAYVLYREARARQRAERQPAEIADKKAIKITRQDGASGEFDIQRLADIVAEAAHGLSGVDGQQILDGAMRGLFDGIPEADVVQSVVMSARSLIEREPDYSYAAARLLLYSLRNEVLETHVTQAQMSEIYPDYFPKYIKRAIDLELLDEQLASYDLEKLGRAIEPERDWQFTYLGLQTLCDRYFLHHDATRIELPQAFFMRISMGLAVNEIDRDNRAIEFYRLLSSFDFMSSTPTLFNAGTRRPQLSSCYLTTVPDDLDGIFSAIKDDALLSKFAGGLGNDWTRVRAMGAYIKGTNGVSQGVVPFLKVANDTAVAVNQGGKRKGAMCAYLETWHLDIEAFLELRKNTGDDRRRTHDMNTANWVPDLFMKRVREEQQWTLFSPDETPDLHDLTGKAFEQRYQEYEAQAEAGQLRNFRQLPAVELWRKMLGALFETGHPWITFKDPCNIRSPQQHAGIVHSSNLCTEITLNTSNEEIAVCNLGSINFAQHVKDGHLDKDKLRRTVKTAMRMLDNVIDYNYYSVPQARCSNLKHRPVGLGIMGFQDTLYQLKIPYASEAAVEFADRSMEAVSYYAIEASSDLAKERGAYSSFDGSLWSQGILPIDSLSQLAQERGGYLDVDDGHTLDWDALRDKVKTFGMRNANCMAIAPTATIANICGVSQSIEPTYQNLFVKSNLSGEFTVVNPYLVEELKAQNLWDDVMVNDLKYFDGSVQSIDRIPQDIRERYATAFEIDPCWLVEAAARRQKWIDQAQSLNLYMSEPSGKKMDNLYKLAWLRGLKTTYYLRSMGATHMEKSANDQPPSSPQVCSILEPDCEVCQ